MTDIPEVSEPDLSDSAQKRFATLMQKGDLLFAAGAHAEAVAYFTDALRVNDKSADAYLKIGTICYQQNKDDAAIAALSSAATLSPNNTEILNILGAAFGRAGRTDDSIRMFKRVVEADPTHATAALNCGRLLLNLGRTVEAEAWLAKAGLIRPNHAETLRLLTEARLAIGQPGLAIDSGQRAVHANPSSMEAKLALAQAYLSTRKLERAYDLLREYLTHQPNSPEALYFLAETEEKRGQTEAAKQLYAQVVDLDVDPEFRTLIRLKRALALPVINTNRTSIEADRAEIITALNDLPREPVSDPYRSGGFTNFYLAYQALCDREIQESIAQFYLDCCPGLASVADHIKNPPLRPRKRVAILSSFLRSHTVGYLCRGLIEHLDRNRFEVVLLRAPVLPIEDPVAPLLAEMADKVVDLPDDLDAARSMVKQEQADLIYFPEIGMEDIVYFLAFARLAPVQVMGWGHPVTSGIPNVDAFLSVADMEPDDGADHYSEALVELQGLSICVPEPETIDRALGKTEFGMEESRPAYLCAQSLFKIHPEFDTVVSALLAKDEAAKIYFVSMTHQADMIFQNRLRQAVGSDMDRVKILPRVPSKDFVGLLKSADVLLDIPHWSGGKTTLESLFAGTPIVHWPGHFMRGRHTLAFYKRLDVMDCVVDNAEAYVDVAYQLVHDQPFRDSVKGRIAARAPSLFNDVSAISEISDVFERLIAEAN